MLKDIKSSYFIELLFSHVDEKQKLKVVKFNKNFQKTIHITIANYKYFTGRYIIYESNGIGKEYRGTDNRLLYEGEFFHGERKGKGKEYWEILEDGYVKYEGEFLHGQWNGKGREYYFDNLLIYEGEFLNGKKHGKGIRYSGKDKIQFEGEYFNGKEWIGTRHNYNGKIINIEIGKEYGPLGDLIFDGKYINGKRNGKGKEYHRNGKIIFEGEYKNDLRWNGKGYDDKGKVVYELIDGNGKVKEYGGDFGRLIFEGEYLNGKKHGNGKEYYDFDGLKYEGEYLNGERNGKGKEYNEERK